MLFVCCKPAIPKLIPYTHSMVNALYHHVWQQEYEYNAPLQIIFYLLPCSLLWRSRGGLGSFDNPYKSKDERMKNVGKAGKPIKLLTNHFDLNLKLSSIFRYKFCSPINAELYRAQII